MKRRAAIVTILLLVVCCSSTPSAGDSPVKALAADITRTLAARSGLVLHLGCRDGALAAELAEAGLLVHGLAADAESVAAVRKAITARRLYGIASVDQGRLDVLPYASNLADAIVVDDLPGAVQAGLKLPEVMRVLAPEGVVWLGPADAAPAVNKLLASAGLAKHRLGPAPGGWVKVRKARPGEMDEWTHRAYNAAGTAVSKDTAFGPLKSVRWIGGPSWPMGSGYQESNAGLLAAGGRTFNITLNDRANVPEVPQARDSKYFLAARNAYNGLSLWSVSIRRGPFGDGQGLAKAIVATPDRVYAAVGNKLVAFDAATGRVTRTFLTGRLSINQLAHVDGTLYVAQRGDIRAFDARTGRTLWKHAAQVESMLVADGGVFFATRKFGDLVALDAKTGRKRWQAKMSDLNGAKKQLLFCSNGVVAFVWRRTNKNKSDNAIAGFAAADGRRLWSFYYPSPDAHWPNGVHPARGLIWIRKQGAWHGLSPKTGQTARTMNPKGRYCGGCVRNIATEEFLISTRPLNVFEWDTGRGHTFRGGRHPCRSGVIVANGLLYGLPHGCKCVQESLRGFVAYAPAGATAPPGPALQTGPAAGAAPAGAAAPQDWPMFRANAYRTASTPAPVPTDLVELWRVKPDDQRPPSAPLLDDWLANPLGGDRITAPTVAGGMAFVALTDAHRVVALDAATGLTKWTYTAGGRIDTPPTYYRGLCLFGSYDGWVYCLRATDGALVWRFRAAPQDRRIAAHGQVESAWPVIGGVMVADGVAYFSAGRTSSVDGGTHGYAVDPATGKVLWSRALASASNDLLVREGSSLRVSGGASAGQYYDLKTGKPSRKQGRGGHSWDFDLKLRTLWGGPNRVMDRTWHILSVVDTATHWMRIKQGYGANVGQLVIASPDRQRTYGFGWKYVHWSKRRDSKQEFNGQLIAQEGKKRLWNAKIPPTFQIEAMALAGDAIFAAGPVDRFRRRPGGVLRIFSAKDGQELGKIDLEVPPAADGIAAARGRLYLTTHDGQVICYGAKP